MAAVSHPYKQLHEPKDVDQCCSCSRDLPTVQQEITLLSRAQTEADQRGIKNVWSTCCNADMCQPCGKRYDFARSSSESDESYPTNWITQVSSKRELWKMTWSHLMQRLFQWRVFSGQVSLASTGLSPRQAGATNLTLPAGNKQKIRGKSVLVAGATGGVGRQVVQCLCNEGTNVRALVRDYTKVVWPLDFPVHRTNICFDLNQVAMML